MQLQRSLQLFEVFLPLTMMSPTAETQVTLLNQTRTENVHSSPSYSFHIPWHKTRQLYSDTIVRLTVDSGWTLCTVGLWERKKKLGCCQPVFLFYWNIRLSWQKWMLPGITNEPINQWISWAAIKLMRAGRASGSRGYILGKVINTHAEQAAINKATNKLDNFLNFSFFS